jgi:hypothetical protein
VGTPLRTDGSCMFQRYTSDILLSQMPPFKRKLLKIILQQRERKCTVERKTLPFYIYLFLFLHSTQSVDHLLQLETRVHLLQSEAHRRELFFAFIIPTNTANKQLGLNAYVISHFNLMKPNVNKWIKCSNFGMYRISRTRHLNLRVKFNWCFLVHHL